MFLSLLSLMSKHSDRPLPQPDPSGQSPLFPPGFTPRDEANALVACAFRNGPIEDLHSGRYSSLLEDPTLSRITDAEMKALMLSACRKVEEFLRLRESDPADYVRWLVWFRDSYCQHWER
jgi:hypothetical protein